MLDTPIDLINATVQLEQPMSIGERTVGTGFLVAAQGPKGEPRTILVTADHVLSGMKQPVARIGYRHAKAEGGFAYTPTPLVIRDGAGEPLWISHPDHDVAVMVVKAPEAFARAAIPLAYLSAGERPAGGGLGPGDELMVLGYPKGMAANGAGFPILRAGRIASYPVSADVSPTFLLDFSVFPGNSGGPVFVTSNLHRISGGATQPYIAGILTQQVEIDRERLEIGVVTHARYVVEAIGMLDGKAVPASVKRAVVQGAVPASDRSGPPSLWTRCSRMIEDAVAPVRRAAARMLRNVAVRVLVWAGPEAGSA